MKKVFNHAVIYNGELIPANTVIDVPDEPVTEATEKDGVSGDKRTSRKPKSRDISD